MDAAKELTKEVEKHVREMRQRTLWMLSNPKAKDEVYRVAQRLFADAATGLNLRAEDEHYKPALDAARQRHLQGFPPRKDRDTSCGDAINWEWIVHCAQATGKHVVIVSRDADYGAMIDRQLFLNDWLQQEFRSRVGLGRKITLTGKLSSALRDYAKQPVTQEEVVAEESQIQPSPLSLWVRDSLRRQKDEHDGVYAAVARLLADRPDTPSLATHRRRRYKTRNRGSRPCEGAGQMRTARVVAWAVLAIGVSLLLALASEPVRLITLWFAVTAGVAYFASEYSYTDHTEGGYYLVYASLCCTLVGVEAMGHTHGWMQTVVGLIATAPWFCTSYYWSLHRD